MYICTYHVHLIWILIKHLSPHTHTHHHTHPSLVAPPPSLSPCPFMLFRVVQALSPWRFNKLLLSHSSWPLEGGGDLWMRAEGWLRSYQRIRMRGQRLAKRDMERWIGESEEGRERRIKEQGYWGTERSGGGERNGRGMGVWLELGKVSFDSIEAL